MIEIPDSLNQIFTKGDVGPAGGLIFYDAGSLQNWGRYLEVAPNGWHGPSGDPKRIFCDVKVNLRYLPQNYDIYSIGAGKRNTIEIVKRCEKGAAKTASQYAGGGKKDWYLPSINELAELAAFVLNRKSWRMNDSEKPKRIMKGFTSYPYWSSTIDDEEHGMSFMQYLSYGEQWTSPFGISNYVRPIRAF